MERSCRSPNDADLEELRAVAGSAPVTFHGFVAGRDALRRRIAEADVALSVCPGETFGLAVAEFAAHNRPVLTSSAHTNRGRARHLD